MKIRQTELIIAKIGKNKVKIIKNSLNKLKEN